MYNQLTKAKNSIRMCLDGNRVEAMRRDEFSITDRVLNNSLEQNYNS